MQTNQDHQRIAAAFERLFRTYGPLGQGSTPEEVARDRVERIKVYFEAITPYTHVDVETAVEAFLNGSAPGVNFNFAPPAPAFASECRRQMNLRLDRLNRERSLHPALPPPSLELSPEQRAKGKAVFDQIVANLEGTMQTPEAAEEARRKNDLLARTNARFMPDMSPAAIRKRLGFDVGDMDGDQDAA